MPFKKQKLIKPVDLVSPRERLQSPNYPELTSGFQTSLEEPYQPGMA